jgi:hypothetical protein
MVADGGLPPLKRPGRSDQLATISVPEGKCSTSVHDAGRNTTPRGTSPLECCGIGEQECYKARVTHNGGRGKKSPITALARKLLVSLKAESWSGDERRPHVRLMGSANEPRHAIRLKTGTDRLGDIHAKRLSTLT